MAQPEMGHVHRVWRMQVLIGLRIWYGPLSTVHFCHFFNVFWRKCPCKILYCKIFVVVQSGQMICTGVGSECPEWTKGMFRADISTSLLIVLAFVLCCVFCAGISKCVLTVGPNPNRSHNLSRKSQQQQKHGRPSFLRSSPDQVFAAMVRQSSPAKPAKNVMERLCRDLWGCRIFHASAIHKHVSVEPCAVFAKDDQEAREVKGRIQQNNLMLPLLWQPWIPIAFLRCWFCFEPWVFWGFFVWLG